MNIQTFCHRTWHQHQALPMWQLLHCWQGIHQCMQVKMAMNHLLWHKCWFSELPCQKSHQGHHEGRQKSVASCQDEVAWCWRFSTLAICFAICSVHPQHSSCGWWKIKARNIFKVGSSMKHNHTFGCLLFGLQKALAAGSKLPKWSPRARLGINLGPSPNHAWNVNLVLHLSSGLVLPQFHCRFDDFFETTRYSAPGCCDISTVAHSCQT